MQLSLWGVSIGVVVTRLLLLLGVTAAMLCLAALPFCIVDEGPAPQISAVPVAAPSPAGVVQRFAWLQQLADVELLAVDRPDPTPAAMDALDSAVAVGVTRCAPEIFGFDRAWVGQLQPDWAALKPNLRPSWDAWQAIDGVGFDIALARSCAEIMGRADCTTVGQEWEACTAPFHGTVGEGGACDVDDQCLSDVCVDGACIAPNDCEDDDDCPPGMACTGEGWFFTCTERLPGDEEQEAKDMFDRLARASADFENYKKRVGREKDDASKFEPKDADDEVQPDPLHQDEDEGCLCDAERDGKACLEEGCVRAVVVDVGARCDELHLCRGVLASSMCIEGRCARAFDVGHACETHEQCKDDLRCLDQACEPPRHAGVACDDDDACAFGLSCVNEGGDDIDDEGRVCGLGLLPTPRPRPPIFIDFSTSGPLFE